MAITTYAELQTAIASWLNRDDLTSLIPDFITLAETDIARWLRVWWNEKRAETIPVSSYVELPTDYLGMRNIQWNYSTYRVPLEQVSPEALDRLEMNTQEDVPAFYAVHDGQIELRPSPSAANDVKLEISYYARPTVLSDSNTSNEILANAPDLLLYGALMIAAKVTLDEMRIPLFQSEYERVKAEVMRSSTRATWGEGNALRMRAM
jgi:hypothetical protein